MEPQEMAENTEKAHESGQRGIGLTMAIFAVLLAVATMMSHRAHTEEVLLETQATDQWNYYQAKNIRYHVYDADAELAGLFGDKGTQQAADFHAKSAQQKKDSEAIQVEAEKLGKEVIVAGRKAAFMMAASCFWRLPSCSARYRCCRVASFIGGRLSFLARWALPGYCGACWRSISGP